MAEFDPGMRLGIRRQGEALFAMIVGTVRPRA